MKVYEALEEYLREDRKGILVTVVRKMGAAPREEGAKMFVGEDGKSFGTIGGGRLEAEACEEALKAMGAQGARMLHFRMDNKAVEDEGMICGGNVDVLLEPALPRHRELYKRISYCEKRGKQAVVVTRFDDRSVSKTLLEALGGTFGDAVEGLTVESLRPYAAARRPTILEHGTVMEPVKTASNLYIFGAGHVSQYLARVASMVDFNTTVIDDRAEFANRERFPETDTLVVDELRRSIERMEFTDDAYVVILTRGHKHDALVLERVVKEPVKYIGMIGSTRKVELVLNHLRDKGISEDRLKTVHAPIGLDINSETPQEIAVSIAAELIQVRGAV
jgi:xanthine dehydrogenase accessory factor